MEPGQGSKSVFVAAHQKSFVSQSGLVAVLKHVRDHGLPDSISRRAVKRERDKALPADTACGPLWMSVRIEMCNGAHKEFPVLSPMAMLSLQAAECAGFAEFLWGKLQQHRNSQSNMWDLAVYMDEISPGNALKVSNERKLVSFYWSVCQFEDALGAEPLWFHLASVRASFVKNMKCGVSQLFRELIKVFFISPTDASNGVMLRVGNFGRHMFFARLGLVVGDEVALKQAWSFRGAAATFPCFLCQNLVSWSSGLADHDHTGTLVSSATTSLGQIRAHSNDSLSEAADMLTQQKPLITKTAFTTLEQSLGLTYSPEGALWCKEIYHFMRDGGPIGITQYDWMHCFFVSGVWNTEVGLLFGKLALLPSCNSVAFDDFLGKCFWPRSLSDKGNTGKNAFKKRAANDSGDLKVSASEGLSLYPVLRQFLYERLSDPPNEANPCVQSYYGLCEVLDLLARSRRHQIDGHRLSEAASNHMTLRICAYGPESLQPKSHYGLHMGAFVRGHPRLVSCWVHERKHKELKRFANQSSNANKAVSWERSLLQDVVLTQLAELKELDVSKGPFLVNPGHPKEDVAKQVRMALKLGPEAKLSLSKTARLQTFEVVAHNDVAVVGTGSDARVGLIWFHVSVGSRLLTAFAQWAPQGGNKFRIQDEPSWVETSDITKTCVHWVHECGTIASVAP